MLQMEGWEIYATDDGGKEKSGRMKRESGSTKEKCRAFRQIQASPLRLCTYT